MLARNGRLLLLTAALLTLASIAPLAGALTLASALPDAPDIAWAYPWSRDITPPEATERRQRVETSLASVADSTAVTWLANPARRAELVDARTAYLASPTPFEGGQGSVETRAALAANEARKSAEGSGILAIGLFATIGLAGALSALRLVLPWVTAATCVVLLLNAATGVLALVLLDTHPMWMLGAAGLSVVGFWGLLIGTHLLPDVNHRLVVNAEEKLRALPPSARTSHVLLRVLGGLLLAAVAILASALSYAFAVPGGVYAAYVGALAVGLIASVLPLLAAVRVAAATR